MAVLSHHTALPGIAQEKDEIQLPDSCDIATYASLYSETYNNLSDRLIGFHHSMRLPNVLKAEHSGWLFI